MLTDIPLAAARYAALLNTVVRQGMPDAGRLINWARRDVGIYEQHGFNDLPWLVQWPHAKDVQAMKTGEGRLEELRRQGYRSDYGSADNIDQVLERYPDLVTSDRLFLLTYSTLTPQNSPGWRWHKNGPYIGTGEPQYEHLGDETTFDKIITWHVWEVRPDLTDLGGHWSGGVAQWLEDRMAGRVAPMPVLGR